MNIPIKQCLFSKYLSLALVIAFITALSLLGSLYVGTIIVVIIAKSGVAALIAWLLTTFNKPLATHRLYPSTYGHWLA